MWYGYYNYTSTYVLYPPKLITPVHCFNKMTLSSSSSAYSLPGGYNLRANSLAAQNAPPFGSGNFPNPIEKRVKLAHSHPERSLISKVQKKEGEYRVLIIILYCLTCYSNNIPVKFVSLYFY